MSDTFDHVPVETRSPHSRMRAAHEEFMQLAQAMARVGDHFAQALEDTANEATMCKARVAELEAMNHDIVQENHAMKANRDDAAYRKLRHIRRVVQSLLEELGPEDDSTSMQSSSSYRARRSSSGSQSRKHRNQSLVPTADDDVLNSVPIPRQESVQVSSSPAVAAPAPPSPNQLEIHPRSKMSRRSPTVIQSTALRSLSSPSQDLSIISKKAYRPQDDLWKMSYTRTPRSAEVVCPIRWAWFQERLGLDEATVYSLESLAQMDDLCFRVFIIRDMAFVYEPLAMDGSFTSIIMDWGSPTDNMKTVDYIQEKLSDGNVFHTFTFPDKDPGQNRYWYYIGAHAWTITRHYPVWPELSEKSKGTVLAKLNSRCGDAWSASELREMLDDGRLDQFCVEVSSASLRGESEVFARNLDYSRPLRKTKK